MKNWFLQKNDSEQKIIVILAVFTALILLYTFLYLPLQKSNRQLQGSINDIQKEIVTMQGLETQLSRFPNAAIKKAAVDDGKMMVLIEAIAKQQQIPVSMKSQGKNKISLTLSSVDFNAAMRWLDVLQAQQHISISQLTVVAENKGLTTITAVISH
jgi:type II secretory pathway component PulM